MRLFLAKKSLLGLFMSYLQPLLPIQCEIIFCVLRFPVFFFYNLIIKHPLPSLPLPIQCWRKMPLFFLFYKKKIWTKK